MSSRRRSRRARGDFIPPTLETLRDILPPNGSVLFTRTDLTELLEGEVDSQANRVPSAADFTVAEITKRFDRSPQTVRDWIKAGKLPAYLFNGKEYRITPAALEEFEEGQRNGLPGRTHSGRAADLGAWRRARSYRTPGARDA